MPVYEVECEKCGAADEYVSSIEERNNVPACKECDGVNKRVISPTMGRVMFPAAGGQEYLSPVNGRPITTQRARRDDLARTHSRQWEGLEQEIKEDKRQLAYKEAASDKKLEESARKAYAGLSPEKKRVLGG